MNRKDRTGQVFGRLKVIKDSGRRSKSGDIYWLCKCECGSEKEVSAVNLNSGKTKSCGCLARELSSDRAKKIFSKPDVECKHPDCKNNTRKGGQGYCGKHYQRLKRYGDADYKTPEEVRIRNLRLSQLQKPIKASTYRKFYGRHEHRVIGEMIAGRELRSDEHVHHIDGNKHNNHPSNLQILTAEEHARLHAMENAKCLETTKEDQ